MPSDALAESTDRTRRIVRRFIAVFIGYCAAMAVLWAVGFEAIYGHPTPFYAAPWPSFTSAVTPAGAVLLMGAAYWAGRRLGWPSYRPGRGRRIAARAAWIALAVLVGVLAWQMRPGAARFLYHVPAIALPLIGILAWRATAVRLRWFDGLDDAPRRAVAYLLLGLMAWLFFYSGSVAFIRDGLGGISEAYERPTLEFIGDIGLGGSLRGLFGDYLTLHPHLSMHAKVHPPGPIAVLWLFAILLGNGALALSLATMAFATLSVPFLYLWARRITGRRVALTACLLLGFIPSIVLFTATSADALFLPFTLATLWLFHKALDRSKAVQWAAAAGLGYGLMSIMKFTLLGFGAYFAIVALWRMSKGLGVLPVARVAVVMLAAFLAFHGLLYWWSGFDYVGAFMAAKAQFALDQHHLDLMEPRYPGWAFKVLNPLAWFYFAGIPVSLMAIGRVVRRTAPQQTFFYALALVLLALDLLYLARGEGERSALYVFPLVALPAAHRLDELAGEVRSQGLVAATLAFLAFQCWFTETLFYTYW